MFKPLPLILLLGCLGLSACSLFESATEDTGIKVQESFESYAGEPEDEVTAVTDSSGTSASQTYSGIEVIWEMPDDDVDGYIINYGFERDKLDRSVKVAIAQLERTSHPDHGFAYRYIIPDLDEKRTLYLTISAYTGEKVSLPSPIQIVAGKS